MTEITLVTINILNDMSLWGKRRYLLIDQLAEINPDIIALQEVSLKGSSSNAHWLTEALNSRIAEVEDHYDTFLCPKTGNKGHLEGIATLSRFPVKRHEILDLLTQNRVAQLLELRLNGTVVTFVNGHFFWGPEDSNERKDQIELMLDWLDTQPAEIPVIVVGDFNGLPDSPPIDLMRQYFDSAHRAVHGIEPEYTCPTPLPNSARVKLRNLVGWGLGKRVKPDPNWKGTLDYIFVDPRLHTLNCKLVLDKPSESDLRIYPSDHFGIYATIKVN